MTYREEFQSLKEALDTNLDQLQGAKVIRKRIRHVKADIEAASQKVIDLHKKLEEEKQDVERLKKLSLTNLYHTLINDKTQQLDQEEQEVLEVKLQIDRLAAERMALQTDLDKLLLKEVSVDVLEQERQRLLQKKKGLIAQVDNRLWDDIRTGEDLIEEEKLQLKEISEAIHAGVSVLSHITGIQKSLDAAAGWGTYDMLGGGLLATMVKRGHLEDAQHEMHQFQASLRSFNRELQDIGNGIDFDIQIGNFLSFADWFFDGFFVDWAVQSKIHDAKTQMAVLEGKIRSLIAGLRQESSQCNNRIDSQQVKIAGIIERA